MIDTKPIGETNVTDMARMMVGRDVLLMIDKPPAMPERVVLDVEHLVVAASGGVPAILNVSFQVREGEILGVAGVNGNGQTELVEAITGLRPIEGGSVRVMERDIARLSVDARRRTGMAHIPEDRLSVGLNLQTSLDENLIVSRYKTNALSRLGFLRRGAMRRLSEEVVARFDIASARAGSGIATLSGGNLQKVVLGRELSGEPKLIIANQPTRGLDVGSIEFVHRTLVGARERGAAILLVSVELDEIMSLSDRVLVLFRGQIAGEMNVADATQEKLGVLMAGGSLREHSEAQDDDG
jgi:simple sugar transport system ATP-binding protein